MPVTPALVTSGGLPYRVVGAQRETITNVTMDSSYLEGGEPLTAAQLGLNIVDSTVCNVIAGTESSTLRGIAAYYTPSTSLIHVIDDATGKEVASTGNLEKVVVQVVARGR
jgi:hypothetical protein